MAWRSDLPAHTEQIRPCPVHPGKSAFLPVKELSLKSSRSRARGEDPALSVSSPFRIRGPSLKSQQCRLRCYGVSGAGVDVGVGSGTSTPAISRPATSETAVRIIVNAVSIPDTVSRSIRADMLR